MYVDMGCGSLLVIMFEDMGLWPGSWRGMVAVVLRLIVNGLVGGWAAVDGWADCVDSAVGTTVGGDNTDDAGTTVGNDAADDAGITVGDDDTDDAGGTWGCWLTVLVTGSPSW
jgi:hypothetical protein